MRRTHLATVGPFGSGVPTLATYGALADTVWAAFESIDSELERAMHRPFPYEPISALEVSFSAEANVYVAARYWLKDDRRGIRDLFTFSTGPAVEALYRSGRPPELITNPYLAHINENPKLLAHLGLLGHHYDAWLASQSTDLPEGLRVAIANGIAAFLARKP